jgi:4-hydroxy-tetrahydrodipicolinate synthase
MARLEGTIPALLTPFADAGRELDLGVMDAHVEWLGEQGVRTVSPMGTTGEGVSLSVEERKRLVRRLAAHPRGVAQVPGTHCTSLPETIELSRWAVAEGVLAVLVAPPTYYVPDQAGVLEYYARLLEALPDEARVVLYHIPRQTRVPIELPTIRALVDRFGPKVAGVKDSGRDIGHTALLIRELPSVAILNGSDGNVAQAYALGGPGMISATANVLPEEFERMRAGDASAQAVVAETRALLDGVPIQAALKLVLHLVSGLPRSSVRPPLRELTREEDELVRTRFAELRGAPVG